MPVAPVANIAAANVPAGNNVAPAALTTIEDDQVPLAVNNEDDADTDANDAAELTTIEDEEVAKAAGIPADGLQNAWGWIAGVAAVALGKGAVDIKARKAKNQEKENDDTK